MILYIALPINLEKVEQSYSLAIVYSHKDIYEKLTTHKVLIDTEGKIAQHNYQTPTIQLDRMMQRTLTSHLFMINQNAQKSYFNIGRYGKAQKRTDAMFRETTSMMKEIIAMADSPLLLRLQQQYEDELYTYFLNSIAQYQGKRFVKLYAEALEFLWNIAQSLFQSLFYHQHMKVAHYHLAWYSYIFYFCIDYVNKVGITPDDLDNNYHFKAQSVKIIFRFFNERLHSLETKINLTQKTNTELKQFLKIK